MAEKIYSYRVTNIKLFEGSKNYQPTVIVDVHYSLAVPTQAASGSEGTVTLRIPRNDDEPLSSLLRRARLEAPKVLREAADLITAHIPEDGLPVQNKEGFGP